MFKGLVQERDINPKFCTGTLVDVQNTCDKSRKGTRINKQIINK